ncbi:RNA methyltransferase, partial [Microcoleus sp.]
MVATASANIRIVLVEPAGPLNVGSVARVMKNMGLHQLILVNPQCDYLGEEARLMAVRAADILENARVVESLPAALVGCTRAIATTGDDRPLATKPEAPADALPWLLEAPSALIFGREDCGLTNAELNYAQRLIRIPSSDAYTSLNLAQAVAVCCYELYKLVLNPPIEVNSLLEVNSPLEVNS